jgi:hypothetical protein
LIAIEANAYNHMMMAMPVVNYHLSKRDFRRDVKTKARPYTKAEEQDYLAAKHHMLRDYSAYFAAEIFDSPSQQPEVILDIQPLTAQGLLEFTERSIMPNALTNGHFFRHIDELTRIASGL